MITYNANWIQRDEEIEGREFMEQYEANQKAAVTKWASVMGISRDKLEGVASKYQRAYECGELTASNFSSPEMFQNFMSFMKEYN